MTDLNVGQFPALAIDIEASSDQNPYFRHVIFTSDFMQLVLMTLEPGEEIGEEIHPETDQFLRFEFGQGRAVIAGRRFPIFPGAAFFIPRGTRHNFINTGQEELKLYTLYSPPHHPDGLIEVDGASLRPEGNPDQDEEL